MKQVNVYEAKTNLSRLLEQVEAGEEIIIARAGKPVARLTAYNGAARREPGAMRGQIWIADDFDETSEDIIRSFYQSDIEPPT